MFCLCRLSSVGRASHSYRFLSVYASSLGNQGVKRSLKRGNLNRSAVGNPVLVPLGMSVETLHDPPKALLGYGEEKVQTTNITLCDGSENCSWHECGGRVFESHRRHHLYLGHIPVGNAIRIGYNSHSARYKGFCLYINDMSRNPGNY